MLQAAGLTPEEKRDILSTFRNSLVYEVIAQALQGLWEQLLGANYHEEIYSEDTNDWYPEESRWWDHQGYAAEWDDEQWWPTTYDDAFPTLDEPNEIDDEKVKEAQQAERVAEQRDGSQADMDGSAEGHTGLEARSRLGSLVLALVVAVASTAVALTLCVTVPRARAR